MGRVAAALACIAYMPLPCPSTPPPAFSPPGTVILSYFSAFLSTPLLMLVPMITVRGAGAAVEHGG